MNETMMINQDMEPTIKTSRVQLLEEESKESHDQKLHQLYTNLQRDWDSLKRSTYPTARLRRSYSSPFSNPNISFQKLHLLRDSPMSSLQHNLSPTSEDGTIWKIRTNDLAVEEIIRDRMAVIKSGRLKGRRLFEESEITEMGFGEITDGMSMFPGLNNIDEDQIEVRSVMSSCECNNEGDEDDDSNNEYGGDHLPPVRNYHCCSYSSSASSSSSHLSGEYNNETEGERKREKMVESRHDEEEEDDKEIEKQAGAVRRFVIASVILAFLILLISSGSFVGYEDDYKVTLVPT